MPPVGMSEITWDDKLSIILFIAGVISLIVSCVLVSFNYFLSLCFILAFPIFIASGIISTLFATPVRYIITTTEKYKEVYKNNKWVRSSD